MPSVKAPEPAPSPSEPPHGTFARPVLRSRTVQVRGPKRQLREVQVVIRSKK